MYFILRIPDCNKKECENDLHQVVVGRGGGAMGGKVGGRLK